MHAVVVRPPRGAESRVKLLRIHPNAPREPRVRRRLLEEVVHRGDDGVRLVWGQRRIDARFAIGHAGQVDVHGVVQGVDTRVGARRSAGSDGFMGTLALAAAAREGTERVLDDALYGPRVSLPLEPVEVRAVVLDPQEVARRGPRGAHLRWPGCRSFAPGDAGRRRRRRRRRRRVRPGRGVLVLTRRVRRWVGLRREGSVLLPVARAHRTSALEPSDKWRFQ